MIFTCREIAKALGCSHSTVHRYMGGRDAEEWWWSLHPSIWDSEQARRRLIAARPDLESKLLAVYKLPAFARLYGLHRAGARRLLDRMILPTVKVTRTLHVVPLSALLEADGDFVERIDGWFLRAKAREKEAPRFPLPAAPGPKQRPWIPGWKD